MFQYKKLLGIALVFFLLLAGAIASAEEKAPASKDFPWLLEVLGNWAFSRPWPMTSTIPTAHLCAGKRQVPGRLSSC